MTSLAVIIARAGSKGLKRKNVLPLAGKPLVAWSLEHARQSRLVEHVVLSTDSSEAAAIAREMNIQVIERPAELANDTATVDSAVRDTVTRWESAHRTQAQHIVILYGNVPIRPNDLTDRALAKLIETGCDSVQSVYQVGKEHPFWMRKLTGPGNDMLEQYQPNRVYRRQELPPVYMLDGGVIAVTRASLFTVVPDEPHAFLGNDRRAVVTREDEVVDIDDELDLIVAEAMITRRHRAEANT